MTTTLSDTPTDADELPSTDVAELVEEHRDTLERLADSELPFAPRARAALTRVDDGGCDE